MLLALMVEKPTLIQDCKESRAKVNLNNCKISKNVGANELKTVWQDPDFNPDLKAFYM